MELGIDIDLTGDVIEWQKLLNGTQIVTIEGAAADGEWTLSGGLSWNVRAGSGAGEGDVILARSDGSELFGSLNGGDVREIAGDDAERADYAMRLTYEIDGGSGEFETAAGNATAEGTLSRESFAGRWRIEISLS